MRISDWSSDVCSSDLRHARFRPHVSLPFQALRRKDPFDHQRARATAAVTNAGYADTAVVLRQYRKEGDDDTRTGSAQWMTHGHGAAIDIHEVGRQSQLLVVGNSHHDRKSTRLNSSH